MLCPCAVTVIDFVSSCCGMNMSSQPHTRALLSIVIPDSNCYRLCVVLSSQPHTRAVLSIVIPEPPPGVFAPRRPGGGARWLPHGLV